MPKEGPPFGTTPRTIESATELIFSTNEVEDSRRNVWDKANSAFGEGEWPPEIKARYEELCELSLNVLGTLMDTTSGGTINDVKKAANSIFLEFEKCEADILHQISKRGVVPSAPVEESPQEPDVLGNAGGTKRSTRFIRGKGGRSAKPIVEGAPNLQPAINDVGTPDSLNENPFTASPAESAPISRSEWKDQLGKVVSEIRGDALRTANADALRKRTYEQFDKQSSQDAIDRALDADVYPEQQSAYRAEDAYIRAYKAYHVKRQNGSILSAGAEKKEMEAKEAEFRTAQKEYIASLSNSANSRARARMEDSFVARELTEAKYNKSILLGVARGKIETYYDEATNTVLPKLTFEQWKHERIIALEGRYNRLVTYNEVIKPSLLRKNLARAEALEERKFKLFKDTIGYLGRKSGEMNRKAESWVGEKLMASGKMSPEDAERVARIVVRSGRLLVTTALVTGGIAAFGSVGALGALGLAGPRLVRGLVGIVGGAAAGAGAGSLYANTIGKFFKKKRTVTRAAIGRNEFGFGSSSVKQIKEAEFYAQHGTDEAIEMRRKQVELGVAALVALGVSVQAAEHAAHTKVVQESAGNIKDAVDPNAATPRGENLFSKPDDATPTPTVQEAPVEAPVPAPESAPVIQPASIEADAGDGADVMFRKLKLQLAEQYKDVENPPAEVKEILETDEHLLSRKYGLAWDSKQADGLDSSERMYVGDKLAIDGEGKLSIVRDGETLPLEEGKGLSDHADTPPKKPAAMPTEEPAQPTTRPPAEAPDASVPEPSPAEPAPTHDPAAGSTEAPHAPAEAAPQPSPAPQAPAEAVPAPKAPPAKPEVAAEIAPGLKRVPGEPYKFTNSKVPWTLPGETKSPFTNGNRVFIDPREPEVYKNSRSDVFIYGGSFDEQRAKATEYAIQHPNTVVRFEGQPLDADGKLTRWTASAVSDGEKVYAPLQPTNESDIGKIPDRDSFVSTVKPEVKAPEQAPAARPAAVTSNEAFSNGRITINPAETRIYKGPKGEQFVFGGQLESVARMAQEQAIASGRPVYTDASYLLPNGQRFPRVRVFAPNGNGGIAIMYEQDPALLPTSEKFRSIIK